MDIEAKVIAQTYICDKAAPPIFHPTKIGFGTVRIKDKLVTSRIQTSLYKHITHNALVHWVGKHSKPSLNFKTANIAWRPFRKNIIIIGCVRTDQSHIINSNRRLFLMVIVSTDLYINMWIK